MRILVTSPTYPPFNSGLGNATQQQAIGLARAGHEVVVASGGSERASRQDDYGVRVELFDVTGSPFLLSPIKGDRSSYMDFLVGEAWDIVLLNAWQNWATDLALDEIDRLSGRKFVFSHCISTNSFFPHRPIRSLVRYAAWRLYWWRLSSVMRKLDGVIFLADGGCDSRFDDLSLAIAHGIPRYIVPNGLSPVAAKLLTVRPKEISQRDRLIAVGSYHWSKGFDFVLRAYADSQLCNFLPLHFFGQAHSDYTDYLKKLSVSLGISSDYVFFHEGISGESLMEEYARARLLLFGSHSECQPLALVDASATGTPFIARATGCINEMAGGVAVSTWRQMADQINDFENSSQRWQTESNSARSAGLNVYHPDLVIERLLKSLNVDTLGASSSE